MSLLCSCCGERSEFIGKKGDVALAWKDGFDIVVNNSGQQGFVCSTKSIKADKDEVLDTIKPKLCSLDNDILEAPLSDEEIRVIAFQMGAKKAPGPDGFTGLFYQSYWDIVGDNVTQMVKQFYKKNKTNLGSAAIKLDMSKAYDRLEWSFLAKAMEKLGFNPKWIRLIMNCISIVSYSILLNGSHIGKFKPERGLRQGDRMSPYLYIVCAEAFTSYIKHLEDSNLVHGIKCAKTGPSISHILFADDSLLFTMATIPDFHAIKNYLQKYCNAIGQEINFNKSGLFFSSKIHPRHRKMLAKILNITTLNLGEKYLGTPITILKSKTQTHLSMLSTAEKRVNNWLTQFLAQAGKSTLVKHVGQAMSLYQMATFLIPKSICNKIDSHLNRYWWGEDLDTKKSKLHLIAWENICKTKKEGGLGFRISEINNLAMMARSVWKLIENPSSLLAQVLKAKYYANSDVLNSYCPDKASWVWKCLHNTMNKIKPFISWVVGEGNFIDPWCNWIPRKGVATPKANSIPDKNLKVSDIINHDTRTWDTKKLSDVFDQSSKEMIQKIPLRSESSIDRRIWTPTKDGVFTTKSAYTTFSVRGDDSESDLWSAVWKLKVPARIQLFVWKALKRALPVNEILHKRIHISEYICPKWKLKTESTMHALVTYSSHQFIYAESKNLISCSAEEAEICGIKDALRVAKEMKMDRIIIEADAAENMGWYVPPVWLLPALCGDFRDEPTDVL
ncbi:uncharacterized protein LOC113305093 [Papaver somniferum]|uniref:uncharacterized protein LOC113305093 n=1 Tax=Papaver somniferum TaxID=3469 RepID=UPI000E6FEEE1|nr:uncharacterized protein LOC113305093 [Papaver somniferum]